MKTLLSALILSLSSASFASIINSDYEPRHIKVIEEAILAECGEVGKLVQTSSEVEIIRIDQGIRDISYTTEISGMTVYSYFSDSYDHDARNWGIYSVTSVKCARE